MSNVNNKMTNLLFGLTKKKKTLKGEEKQKVTRITKDEIKEFCK